MPGAVYVGHSLPHSRGSSLNIGCALQVSAAKEILQRVAAANPVSKEIVHQVWAPVTAMLPFCLLLAKYFGIKGFASSWFAMWWERGCRQRGDGASSIMCRWCSMQIKSRSLCVSSFSI